MVEPRRVHLIVAKNVLRNPGGIVDYGLQYVLYCEFRPMGYIDSDWARSVIDQKSTSQCYFSLGPTMISWLNMK